MALATVAVVLAGGLGACGRPDESGTAPAITDPAWAADGRLVGHVECADRIEVSVEAGAGVEGVPLVTATGRPKLGRCRPTVTVDVPAGTTRIEDAATGTVVDLPAP